MQSWRFPRSLAQRGGWFTFITLALIVCGCDTDTSSEQESQPPCTGGRCDEAFTPPVNQQDATMQPPLSTCGSSEELGQPCGCGGRIQCQEGSLVCVGGEENACGGCLSLEAEPGTPCGVCGEGALSCSGPETLRCVGDKALNECGGCASLEVEIGGPCGDCGLWTCQADPDALPLCEEQPRNSCGGCGPLVGAVGDACGACGQLSCDPSGALSCDDPGPIACRVTRLIAMGDTGEASEMQYRVSAAAQAHCDRAGGCDGFVMLGDNIYDTGAESAMDEQLTTKIDLPYANLKAGPPPAEGEPDERPRMPLYVSLGNHDLGGAGINSAQVQYYLAYARANDWFYYPEEFWHLQVGSVHLISLHTNPLAYGIPDDLFEPQARLVSEALAQTSAPWTLAVGHHPYRSNGRHGNAGAYEGIPLDIDLFGGGFRRWIDSEICNRVDFYLSGHDHNRQWLNSVPLIPNIPEGGGNTPCETHFAVSGAGAKTTDLEGRGNDTAFEDDSKEGFLFMEFHHDFVNVEFCDYDGVVDWSRRIER
ncbi:MAG: metallophosphoesterase [Myxococcota bacterium]|nr:metallophosphoesterase [Myxococcota bacterium]